MIRRILLVAAVIVVSAALAVAPFHSGPALASDLVVQTADGAVQGALADGVADTEAEWLGIPYAAPPLGALRWQPPQPVTPWPGVRDGTQFTPPCIQTDFNGGTLGSEDCLYLNVFAPPTAAAGASLPVMVYLHPGGNAYFQPYSDASAFTSRGVIVVTLNYRLGVFGFVGLPELSAEQGGSSGEYGLLDQLAALRWLQGNIAAFGGDPANVTLFGSSAGSFDTVALMASPLSHGLITRAAVQGDVLPGLTGADNNTIAGAEQIGVQVAQQVGCQTAPDVLACLRAAPAATLVEAAPTDYVPWVGGKVLPKPPLQLLSSGPRIPLLVGFDREEQSTIGGYVPPPGPYRTSNWVRDTNFLGGPPLGAQIRSLYPASAYDALIWSTVTAATDALRGCPTRRLANTVSQGAPVWFYLYTHTYENDPSLAQYRAAHIFEDPFLWGDFSQLGSYVPTLAERTLSGYMTDYWTSFAKTGNPNSPNIPGLPAWPHYNTATEPTLTLDDPIGVINNYHDQQCALLDTITNIFPPPWLNGEGVGPSFVPPHLPPFVS